jgi:hypothetical protein
MRIGLITSVRFVNRVVKSIRRLTRRKSHQRWENKIKNWGHISRYMAYCEVPYEEGWTKGTNCNSWSIRPKISSAAESQNNCCLENQFAPHDLCEYNHERRVEARVQALLETVDKGPPWKSDFKKLINSLELWKAVDLKAFQMNASGTFQEDHWYI